MVSQLILVQSLFLKVLNFFLSVIQLDVKEAKKVEEKHPQWDISDDEEEKKSDHGSESDLDSEDDSSNDEN